MGRAMSNRLKKLQEGLAELAAQAETDHELQMARSQLYKTAKYAIKLHEMLKNRVNLEAWQAAKITKASDYLSSVYHSLDYEMSPASDDMQIETKESKEYMQALHKKLSESLGSKMNTEPELTVDDEGTKRWRLNGKRHREDGPAVIYADGSRFWYQNDMLHRTDGPAVIHSDGDLSWYLNGKEYLEDDWLTIIGKMIDNT